MARPKAFEVDQALDQAMRTFWRRGYRGTSVRDLCEAMAIGSGSFYATFGSKGELFRLALSRYLRSIGLTPGPGAIRGYFDRVIADRDPTGCLLVGSAVEHDALEPDAQKLVSAGLAGLEDFFWHCLRGRAGARQDARVLATTVAGLHVLHRTGADREQLRAIADRLLSALDIPPAVE
ncbi:MAG: helix-turn-helix domain-containing protein [Myxococcota bacterium]